MKIVIENLAKNFDSFGGRVAALNDISFTIEDGEFYTLLGPSGCGKSTTMRCLAGLERPDSGTIRIGDTLVAGKDVYVPPDRRPIGMVFQSYAIWPHMTVFKNVAFPLSQGRGRVPKKERHRRVMEALDLVQMGALADRPAPFLSGGQQQRVALARALVLKPGLLLLDEPLSNLDAKLREDLRVELKELTRRLGITTLYVTHDQLEALTMSDRIAVMLDGRILQEAAPRELYLYPRTEFVARFIGQVNFLAGRVLEGPGPDGFGKIGVEDAVLSCPLPATARPGEPATIVIRPESLTLAAGPDDGRGVNSLRGKVTKAIFVGDAIDCAVAVGSQGLRVKVNPTAPLVEGQEVHLRFLPETCVVLPAQEGRPLPNVPIKEIS